MTEGLGLWLRRAREAQQLTLDDVEKKLRIRRRYLQALEAGDYSALPGQIQTRGFLRNYARFLGVPPEEALARYEEEDARRRRSELQAAIQTARVKLAQTRTDLSDARAKLADAQMQDPDKVADYEKIVTDKSQAVETARDAVAAAAPRPARRRNSRRS